MGEGTLVLGSCCSRLGTWSRGRRPSCKPLPPAPHFKLGRDKGQRQGGAGQGGSDQSKDLTQSQIGEHSSHKDCNSRTGDEVSPPPHLLPTSQQAGAGSANLQLDPGGKAATQTWAQCRSRHQAATEHCSSSLTSVGCPPDPQAGSAEMGGLVLRGKEPPTSRSPAGGQDEAPSVAPCCLLPSTASLCLPASVPEPQ